MPPTQVAYGADPNRYQFIPRVLIFITHDEQLLLIKRAAHKEPWPGMYNAPGGHVERGEEPYQAALREVEEETGAHITDLQLRGLIAAETGLSGSGILVFVFHSEADDLSCRSSAEGESQWINRAALKDIDLIPDIPQLLQLILDQESFFYLYKTPQRDGSEDIRVRLV